MDLRCGGFFNHETMRQQITHERLLELVEYFPDTGLLVNRINRGNSPKGKVLGTKNASGHLVAQLDKVMYLVHRLVWFYSFKEWPTEIIDHIDRNPSNNRLDNLREANKAGNIYNSKLRVDNTSGLKGVYFDKRRGHYYSQIVIQGKKEYLGRFNSAEEAHTAYIQKCKENHGEFLNEDLIH